MSSGGAQTPLAHRCSKFHTYIKCWIHLKISLYISAVCVSLQLCRIIIKNKKKGRSVLRKISFHHWACPVKLVYKSVYVRERCAIAVLSAVEVQ